MKLKVLSLLCLAFVWISNGIQAQTTALSLGDIAFTGYNSDRQTTPVDREDEFTFVLLKDVVALTEITFTDKGWSGSSLQSGEGTLTISFSSSQSCGDEFRIIKFVGGSWAFFNRAGTSAGDISPSGSFQLSSSGDQILAYQGDVPATGNTANWIAGIQMNCTNCSEATWDVIETPNTTTSAKPSIFNTGNYSLYGIVGPTEVDNGKYGCSITSGDPTSLRAAIYDESNWSYNGNFIAGVAGFCSPAFFSCGTACADPTISGLSTNSVIGGNTFCPGDNVIITITGAANDATSWNLYAGNSCSGTALQTIPVSQNTFSVTATSTTTYSIAGIGGCVAAPTACTAITITVNGLTANAGNDQKVSGSTTANISGNGAGTWSIIGVGDGNGLFAGNTTTSTTPTTTFTGTAGQEYKLRWTVNNAGCPSSSADVVITFLSPTTLGLGDIAFTGVNTDNPDQYTFVLLKDINAGTEITFNENGWLSTDGFRAGENAITFQICRPYACGDEFKVEGTAITDNNTVSAGTAISGSALTLATGGDQIFAYQGSAPTTGNAANWIAAINTDGPWLTTGTVGTLESYKPSAFTDGTNSISFASTAQNAKYGCTITTNSPANLAAAVNSNSNWTTSTNPINLSFCSFTCGSCVEPVLTSVSAPSSACPGQTVALTINGTLNGANEWAIYTGSCGGTLVGTTTSSSFDVTPTATTTYYVSGRGGCVVTETCQTATISVTSVQADAGPDQKLNGGSFTTLQANGGFGDGTWTFVDPGDGQGSFSDINNPAASFSGEAGQSYTLKWTIDNSAAGCPDTEDEVTIVFLSQTGLSLGDIAFISYSADDDDVAFVILKDITAGTAIKFTDNGWFSGGGFRSGEGTKTLEFCRPYTCGSQFNVFDFGVNPSEFFDASGAVAGDISAVSGTIDLSTSGDQLFVYQGNAPTSGNESAFIAAIQMNGIWDADATNSNNSAKPSVFTDGLNSISFSPEMQNAVLDCSKLGTGLPGPMINTASNWITTSSPIVVLPLNCNINCCTPGEVTNVGSDVGTGPLCPGSDVTLTLTGQLNDDQSWKWYTSSCGGPLAGTGTSIDVAPSSTTTYYVRAEGSCSGTSGACAEITIAVEDNVPPSLSCPSDITVANDPSLCSAVVTFAATASDNCGGNVDITYSKNPGTAFQVGTTQVDVTATDESGKQSTCSFKVTVNDTEAPTAVCPGVIQDVELDLMGNGTLPPNIGDGNSTDNCGTIETSPELNFTCDDLGIQTVTLTAFDLSGGINTTVCSFNVVDNVGACNQAPVASCKNITVSTAPNTCEATITTADVNDGSSDPDGDPLTLSLDDSGPFAPGIHTVELTVSDGSLSDKCTAMVTVKDMQAPTFSNCPGNISVANDPGDCGANVDWELPIFSDNCPGGSTNSDFDPLDFFPVGSTTVTYEGSDAAGNTAIDCSFVVTVNDTEKPSAQCSPTMVTLSPAGTASITPTDVDNGSTDNCNIASLSASPNSFGTGDVGPNPVVLTVVDIYGNVDTCHTKVTVGKRTSTLTNLGVSSGQYSDRVTLQAQLEDINGTPLANQDITFEITGELPTVTVKTNASGIATASIILTQAPNLLGNNYQVKTSFTGNSLYQPSQDSDPFTILQEDAQVTYTGTYFVSTATTNSSVATVTLAATVEDIVDGFSGDIRNAKVTFYDRTNGSNTPISPALPVQLIAPSDLTVGNVVYEWENVDIGNADSDVFEIGIVVSYYYTRNSMADNVMVTVSKPISSNFITGGGYVLLNNSAGQVAGDDGSKSNFGFNVKYNKKGNKLKGKFQALIRRTESDGVHTYRIKSNKLTSLSVDPNSGTATLSGKANIQDVTDPNNPISVAGNNIFTVTIVDNGEPGTSDAIGITLYNSGGGLWYSSNWSGTQTVDQLIAGGNIVVHSGGSGNLQSIQTLPTSHSSVQESLDINVYPNPTTGIMHIDLTPLRGKDLEVTVFNTLHQRVWQQRIFEATADPLQVDLQGLDSGLYIITIVEPNGERHSQRIVLSGL